MSQLVAITGSSGILGTAVIRLFLTGTKYQLLLIDKAPPNDSEDIKRLKRENGEGRLTESTCDLSDYGALEKVLRSHQENSMNNSLQQSSKATSHLTPLTSLLPRHH